MEDRTRTPAGSGQPIYTGSKDEKKLQKAAYRAGWRPKKKRAGLLWLAPDGVGQVMVHGTTSDHRSLANQRAEFRRAGLNV